MAANRNWRTGGYNSYNQLLQPVSYFSQPISNYSDRKYQNYDDKRGRKDFGGNRRDGGSRYSPNRRRSPLSRQSYDEHSANYRKDASGGRKPQQVGHHHGSGRNEVKAPRVTFDVRELSTQAVRGRYQRLYVPSDFFHADLRWQEAFPLWRPIRLANDCEYQLLNKEVEVDVGMSDNNDTVLDPEDADLRYSAKVMLISAPNMTQLFKQTTKTAGADSKSLGRSVRFLMGTRGGRNEPMALGGAWSPSLDGSEPETDPNVLIKTAIRTCKALSGIDLSLCKKWYKFLEINYYRPGVDNADEAEKKEAADQMDLNEDRIETVVIYIPDMTNCLPSVSEWNEVKQKFSKKLNELLPREEKQDEESKDESAVTSELDESRSSVIPENDEDFTNMKVVELRAKLTEKGLDSKGNKSVLIQRLNEAVEQDKKMNESADIEDAKETGSTEESKEQEDESTEKVDIVTKEATPEPEKPKLSEKEIEHLKKIYSLNENASIIVRPNTATKDTRFDCQLISLDSLLEYRSDDQKEHVFEVSLFAEQFNEMVQRDGLFYIYRSLLNMPTSDLNSSTTESEEPEAKKTKLTETKIRKTKMIPNMHLYYAFSLFDPENAGYIRDHVLEYFVHNLGLNLSRSQVKKLINKIPNRKGSLMYKEVTMREVIEGSVDDIAMLKLQIENCQKLAEISQGNKAFFSEETEMENVCRTGQLEMMDKLDESVFRKEYCQLQIKMLKDEIDKLKKIEEQSVNVATELRDNIQKTKDKLATEVQTMETLSSSIKVYREILEASSDLMGQSVAKITAQHDIERKAKEAERAAAEEKKRLEEEKKKAALAEVVEIDSGKEIEESQKEDTEASK